MELLWALRCSFRHFLLSKGWLHPLHRFPHPYIGHHRHTYLNTNRLPHTMANLCLSLQSRKDSRNAVIDTPKTSTLHTQSPHMAPQALPIMLIPPRVAPSLTCSNRSLGPLNRIMGFYHITIPIIVSLILLYLHPT